MAAYRRCGKVMEVQLVKPILDPTKEPNPDYADIRDNILKGYLEDVESDLRAISSRVEFLQLQSEGVSKMELVRVIRVNIPILGWK